MKYNHENDTIEMTVSDLAMLACPEGHIDSRGFGLAGIKEMAGTSIHKKIQKSHGDIYHTGVRFKNTSKIDDIYFYVTGTPDGIICDEGEFTVDEIKATSNFGLSNEGSGFHAARVYIFAYFFCISKNLQSVNTRLTYYNTDDGEIRYAEKQVCIDELRDYYTQFLSAAYMKASFLRDKYLYRRESAKLTKFPYENLRESQDEMVRECYYDIKQGSRLFCQAPTGIGKTISVIYPSVRAFGDGAVDKIFYLTSKTSIKREAYNAAMKIREGGGDIYTISLSAKEYMCLCDAKDKISGRLKLSCRPDVCKYAKDYYKKRDTVIFAMLQNHREFNRDLILQYAREYEVCPYELSLDLSEYCDLIICDYNYVFSPMVYLRRYFDDAKERYVFLVDEAHNLPKRARDMYSSALQKSDFDAAHKLALYEYRNGSDDLSRKIKDVSEVFDKLGEACADSMKQTADGVNYGYNVSHEPPFELIDKVGKLKKGIDIWQKNNQGSDIYLKIDDLLYKCEEFLKLAEGFGEGYLSFTNVYGEEISQLMYCLDPSAHLSAVQDKAAASIMFSATLTPAEYYAEILGGGEKAVSVRFTSPFDSENLCVAVVDSISTRYEDRERSIKKIVSCIAATASAKAGNYLVFFPSYDYMEKVHSAFVEKYGKVRTVIQKKNMTARDREEFLGFFKDDTGVLRVGFCVIGGMFSEGIDLPGNRLIGSIVVGVGMPGISDTNNIIREYYDEKCGEGYDYAYTYPGFNSVLQATGRVIRKSDDVGIAVLIDDRYSEPRYIRLFPDEWKHVKFAGNSQSLAEIARRFWQNIKK